MTVPQPPSERDALARAQRGDFSLLNQMERAAAERNRLRPHAPGCAGEDKFPKHVIESEIKSSFGKMIGYRWSLRKTEACEECDGDGEVSYRGITKDYTIPCPKCDGENLETYTGPPLITNLMGEIQDNLETLLRDAPLATRDPLSQDLPLEEGSTPR